MDEMRVVRNWRKGTTLIAGTRWRVVPEPPQLVWCLAMPIAPTSADAATRRLHAGGGESGGDAGAAMNPLSQQRIMGKERRGGVQLGKPYLLRGTDHAKGVSAHAGRKLARTGTARKEVVYEELRHWSWSRMILSIDRMSRP